MEGNKHYIKIDSNSNIVYGFSDAFEQPFSNGICINENGGRHFELNGQVNPPLYQDGIPLYKWDGSKAVNLTDTDIQNYKSSLPKVVASPTIEDLQKQIFNLTTQLVNGGVL